MPTIDYTTPAPSHKLRWLDVSTSITVRVNILLAVVYAALSFFSRRQADPYEGWLADARAIVVIALILTWWTAVIGVIAQACLNRSHSVWPHLWLFTLFCLLIWRFFGIFAYLL